MNMNRFFGLLALFVLLPLFQSQSQTAPRIDFFSPQDTVKNVRQVAVRFSDQMVPFGSPKVTTEIFDVDCPEKGAARWADERNWIYDFDRDLPAGVRCEFRVKTGPENARRPRNYRPAAFFIFHRRPGDSPIKRR